MLGIAIRNHGCHHPFLLSSRTSCGMTFFRLSGDRDSAARVPSIRSPFVEFRRLGFGTAGRMAAPPQKKGDVRASSLRGCRRSIVVCGVFRAQKGPEEGKARPGILISERALVVEWKVKRN